MPNSSCAARARVSRYLAAWLTSCSKLTCRRGSAAVAVHAALSRPAGRRVRAGRASRLADNRTGSGGGQSKVVALVVVTGDDWQGLGEGHAHGSLQGDRGRCHTAGAQLLGGGSAESSISRPRHRAMTRRAGEGGACAVPVAQMCRNRRTAASRRRAGPPGQACTAAGRCCRARFHQPAGAADYPNRPQVPMGGMTAAMARLTTYPATASPSTA